MWSSFIKIVCLVPAIMNEVFIDSLTLTHLRTLLGHVSLNMRVEATRSDVNGTYRHGTGHWRLQRCAVSWRGGVTIWRNMRRTLRGMWMHTHQWCEKGVETIKEEWAITHSSFSKFGHIQGQKGVCVCVCVCVCVQLHDVQQCRELAREGILGRPRFHIALTSSGEASKWVSIWWHHIK